MNKMKKISCVLVIFFMILSINMIGFCAQMKTQLSIIEKASEIKYLQNDQGYITKSIVDVDSDKGEVTVELKLSNSKKKTEEDTTTEVFLVVDNSPSMDFVTSNGKTRKELILNSASQLVTSIFENSNNVKIGLVDFHGASKGILGESASIYNAKLRQQLTDNKSEILKAVDDELERKTESGTNIEAGLKTAQKSFSNKNNNKIIILLTDGIPNADISGNNGGNDVKDEENLKVVENTKQTLKEIKESGIYTITLLTGMSESDGTTDKNGTTYTDPNTLEEKLQAAESVFGTEENPTANKYYLVNNVDINKIITEDILKDVKTIIQNPINKIKIVDYFPDDIIENFDFSYVGNASKGNVSDKIDINTKTIEWDIDNLKGDEVATLKYKLKIKDMQNQKLLNKTIATNEKVILTYNDVDEKGYTVTLESSPKIQLSEIKEADTTTATGTLPNTGAGIGIFATIAGLIIVAVLAINKYNKLKNV